MNLELQKAATWFNQNFLTLHPEKTSFMVFNSKNPESYNKKIHINQIPLERVGELEESKTLKFLGLHIDEAFAGITHQERRLFVLQITGRQFNCIEHMALRHENVTQSVVVRIDKAYAPT